MTERPLSSEPAASGCGCGTAVKFDGATPAYRRILMAVIAINGAAFLAIAGGAALQGSAFGAAAGALQWTGGGSEGLAASLQSLSGQAHARAESATFDSIVVNLR